MNKNIWMTLFWVIGFVVFFVPSASADGGKGVKTTLSREVSVQEVSTIVLASPEQAPPPPTRRKCRWVETDKASTSATLSVFLMPTALAGCGSGVVQVGGGVFSTPLPESVTSSSSRVCD